MEIANKTKEFNVIKLEYEKIPNYQNELNELTQNIKILESEIKKIEIIVELQKQIDINFNECEKIKKDIDLKNEQVVELKNLHLSYLNGEIVELKDRIEEHKNRFIEFSKEVQKDEDEYNSFYYGFLSAQAGILAKELKKDSACPVCGSLVHPKPAEFSECLISNDELENKKNFLEKNKIKLSELSEQCSVLGEKLNAKEKEFLTFDKIYNIELNLKDKVLKLDYQNQIEVLNNNISNLEKKYSLLLQKEVELKTKVESLKSELTNSDIKTIQEKYSTMADSKIKLEEKIKNLTSQFNEKQLELNSLKANFELIVEQLREYSEYDFSMDEVNEIISLALQEKNKLNDELKKLSFKISVNGDIFENLKQKYSKFEECGSKYADYLLLSDCANGNIKGKARIAFEQYVQGYYLDMVLFEANKHLRTMSSNQYMLIRKKDIDYKNSKSGLDIEVMDFHTGKTRSSKTLSGGESFIASLSLALGLSDCVSNISGAINIDAMFIDEGFGSLDSDSLELALNVISELSCSKRLIGIISHVNELKTRIQNQIQTIKTDNGSKVCVNF